MDGIGGGCGGADMGGGGCSSSGGGGGGFSGGSGGGFSGGGGGGFSGGGGGFSSGHDFGGGGHSSGHDFGGGGHSSGHDFGGQGFSSGHGFGGHGFGHGDGFHHTPAGIHHTGHGMHGGHMIHTDVHHGPYVARHGGTTPAMYTTRAGNVTYVQQSGVSAASPWGRQNCMRNQLCIICTFIFVIAAIIVPVVIMRTI